MRVDVDQLARRSRRVEVDDLDLDAFTERPLEAGALRCLRYMHDVEHHTVCYLRDLLLTEAHRDPEITTFLTVWVYEEHWHGQAIAAVLAAHGEGAGGTRVAASRQRSRRHDLAMSLAMAAANGLTRHLPALHMTWGAVNECLTQAAYRRLAARADHPVLRELVGRISRQEGRHIDFYASQAERRLDASARARRLTRVALGRLWTPVGAGIMPPAEVHHLGRYLFGDVDGRAAAARIDRRVQRLPGLDGLTVVADALDRLAA